MSIWMPSAPKKGKAKAKGKAKPSVLIPKRDEYRLPVQIVDPRGMTENDADFLEVMMEHQPRSSLKPGDVVLLRECPQGLRLRMQPRMIPLLWKVRFVVSSWTFELHQLAHAYPDKIMGIDHAVSMVEATSTVKPEHYTRPVVYAHAMPHGKWPDTAYWFREYFVKRVWDPNIEDFRTKRVKALQKINVRDPAIDWPTVLDEAKAPFLGYDVDEIVRPYVFDMAPDLYKNGENIGKPLPHEEAAIHTACLLGFEAPLLGDLSTGVDPHFVGSPRLVDEILGD